MSTSTGLPGRTSLFSMQEAARKASIKIVRHFFIMGMLDQSNRFRISRCTSSHSKEPDYFSQPKIDITTPKTKQIGQKQIRYSPTSFFQGNNSRCHTAQAAPAATPAIVPAANAPHPGGRLPPGLHITEPEGAFFRPYYPQGKRCRHLTHSSRNVYLPAFFCYFSYICLANRAPAR